MREGTTSRVMATDRPYGGFHYFYSVSPEYFGYMLVIIRTHDVTPQKYGIFMLPHSICIQQSRTVATHSAHWYSRFSHTVTHEGQNT
jgi:hypothetical protein